HRRRRRPAGRRDRPGVRHLPLRSVRPRRLRLRARRAVPHVRDRAPRRALAVRALAAGDQGQHAALVRGRHRGQLAAGCDLHARGRLCRLAGGVLAQTQAFASLEMFSIDRSADVLLILIIGGTGWLYGGLIGALIYRFLQDELSGLTARYWQFWIGLILVAIVLTGRDRIGRWLVPVARLADRIAQWRPGRPAQPEGR